MCVSVRERDRQTDRQTDRDKEREEDRVEGLGTKLFGSIVKYNNQNVCWNSSIDILL